MIAYECVDGTEIEFDDERKGVHVTRGATGIYLPKATLWWLVLTAGPAALCELAREVDAGAGGGPAPAVPDGNEPPDGPEDEAEPDLFAGMMIADDRVDPHTVACPACKQPAGTACKTPGGMVARPHAARRRLVDGT